MHRLVLFSGISVAHSCVGDIERAASRARPVGIDTLFSGSILIQQERSKVLDLKRNAPASGLQRSSSHQKKAGFLEVVVANRQKTALIVVGITAFLLLALIFVGPALIKVDRYRPQVISFLQENTGKQVEMGRLSLTFFPLSIHINDFGVKNPPIFPRGYVVQVARIDAELDLGALLRRQVRIKSLVLEDPILNMTSDPDGPWNFENPHAQVSQNVFPLGVISRVQIKRGQLIASNLLPSDAAGPVFFEAHQIS